MTSNFYNIPFYFDVVCDKMIYEKQRIGTISYCDTNDVNNWIRYFRQIFNDEYFKEILSEFPWYPDFKYILVRSFHLPKSQLIRNYK